MKVKIKNTLIEDEDSLFNFFPDYSKLEKEERIDQALFNMILDHPELIEEEKAENDRFEFFDQFVGKGGHLRFVEYQIRAMKRMKIPIEKIFEFMDRQANEHRSDLIQDDLRHLKEMENSKWNSFKLEFDENQPGDLGARFNLSFSGVYAVYKNVQIIYIGTAINLRQRFIQHLFPLMDCVKTPLYKYLEGNFNRIKIKTKKTDKKFKRLTLEGILIHKIKPIVNTHYKIRES